ncbi:MAG: glycosyltransferase family 39 protein [Burkholderiaceae bacterium]|nr:glycosyltransferase family 39 protein [Burkholderiaceae bacterium]
MMHASRNVPPVTSLVSRPHASRLAGDDARFSIALMFGWFAAQVALRVLVSDSLELDEAEQTLDARTLALGYGTQPPLYTWLQHAFFRVFGVSVFSLALAKNAMLFAAWTFTLLAARRVMPARAAWLGTLSMLWLVSLSWDAQRDLTHTVLATTTAAALVHAFVLVAQRPGVGEYVWLGIALGLSVLAKYNNVAFAALLAGTALVVPQLRRRVFRVRLAWTIVVAALVVAPHALWLFGHWQLASEGTMSKMGADLAHASALAGWLAGLGSALLAFVGFVTPWWIVVLVFFGRRAWSAPGDPDAQRIARVYLLLFGALLVFLVVAGGVTHFKPRWFVPGLFVLPAMFFAVRPMLAEGPRAGAYRRATLAFGALIFVLLAAKAPVEGRFAKPGDLNEPTGALAAALRADGFTRGVIVSDERRLAARLRVQFPDSRIVLAGEAVPEAASRQPRIVIASDDRLPALLRKLGLAKHEGEMQRVALPYLYGADRPLRARYAWVVLGRS